MNWDEAVQALFGLEKRGIKLELTRMRACLDDLGRPQDSFQSLLVAGTNGKGSTSAVLASCLSRGDRTVGLYTSPHLLDYRERIRLGGRLADKALLLRRVEEDWSIWMKHELSFFEATTALALSAFRDAGVRLAVLEVGLGGRLDATNTVEPILSVITSLGMDHAVLLGGTPEAIALEKAGILRAGIPMAFAGGGSAATNAVLRRAEEVGAIPYLRRACLQVRRVRSTDSGISFQVRRRPDAPAGFALPTHGLQIEAGLPGRHQVANASLAILSLAILRGAGLSISDEEIRSGIRRLRWPGRCERPLPTVPLLADVAHNREGARVLVRHCLACAPGREIRPVVGMLATKDHVGFFRELKRIAPEASIAPLLDPRAAAVDDLAKAAEAAGVRTRPFPTLAEALRRALSGLHDPAGPLVLLCGSFHTLDEGYRSLGIAPMETLWDDEKEPAEGNHFPGPLPTPDRKGDSV